MKCTYLSFIDIAKDISLRSDANFVLSFVHENTEDYYQFSRTGSIYQYGKILCRKSKATQVPESSYR